MFSNSVLFFSYSYDCNAVCEKCLNRYHRLRNFKVSQAVCDRFLELLRLYDYDGTIEFGSGESLIASGFVEFVQKVLLFAPRSNVKILSNGIRFNKELPRSLLENPRLSWGITFDGFFNDDLIGLQKGVNLEKIKQAFRDFEILPKNIYLNYTLTSKNVFSLSDFLRFCHEMHIPKFYVTPIKIFAETQSASWAKVDFNDSRVKEALASASELALSLKLTGNVPLSDTQKTSRCMCWTRGRAWPVVDIDGTLSFCMGREDVTIGNILDADIVERWEEQRNKLMKKPSEGVAWCAYCSGKPDNHGVYPTPKGKFNSTLS